MSCPNFLNRTYSMVRCKLCNITPRMAPVRPPICNYSFIQCRCFYNILPTISSGSRRILSDTHGSVLCGKLPNTINNEETGLKFDKLNIEYFARRQIYACKFTVTLMSECSETCIYTNRIAQSSDYSISLSTRHLSNVLLIT